MFGILKPAYAKSPELMAGIKFPDPVRDDLEHVTLFKSGRSTGLTKGSFRYMVQARITKERKGGKLVTKVTHELMAATPNGTFGKPGDSGSFVFDNLGGVVRMLLTGFEIKETGYFTPLENIFKDIKEVVGAEDVRIAH